MNVEQTRMMSGMKKRYIAPVTEAMECVPASAILKDSLPYDNSGPSNEDDFDGEATGTVRGDWDNIWKEM